MKPLRECKYCKIKAFTKSGLERFVIDEKSKHGRKNVCKKCNKTIESKSQSGFKSWSHRAILIVDSNVVEAWANAC